MGLQKSLMAAALGVVLVASLLCSSRACQFPAIYNFGDSNSDTGTVSAAFGRLPPPNGETFFGKPSGRYSDGRLIIDFTGKFVHFSAKHRLFTWSTTGTKFELCSLVWLLIVCHKSGLSLFYLTLFAFSFVAGHLGLPFLNAYVDSIGSNFSHGACFAASGSTLQPVNAKIYEAGFNPFSVDVQLLQFEQLKDRTEELYSQG